MARTALADVDVSVLQLYNLPVVASFLERLQVRKHIDSLCPSRSNANVTHGQIIECLVANRLSAPRPLYDIQNWAATLAIPEVFGVKPDELNDDRIGRALDVIAGKIEVIQGSIVVSAISTLGLNATTIHWDVTSLFFAGEYPEEDQDPKFPTITYGYSSQNFSGVKQIRAGHGVTSDGSVPVWQQVFNGNENDVRTVTRTMRALREHAKLADFLMVGDSKLLSLENILAFIRSDLGFLGPSPSSKSLDEEFLSIPREEFHPLDYVSVRQERLPEDERSTYLGYEQSSTVTDPESGKSCIVRKIFIISSEERDARRKNRARQMERAAIELEKLRGLAGSRYYPTQERVLAKCYQILKEKRVSRWFSCTAGEQDGKISFGFEVNQENLARTESLDGYYVLLTNLSCSDADTTEVLRRYKGQYRAERRFRESKHVLKVRPLFLSDNARIEALVFVIGVALMVFSLIEREARRNLPNPKDKIAGLLAGHVAARPTGENIFRAFSYFHAVVLGYQEQRAIRLPPLQPAQATLLRLLGIDGRAMHELLTRFGGN